MSDIEILFRAVGEHLWRVSRRPPQMTFRGLVLVAGVYSSIALESLFMTPSGTGRRACRFVLAQAWRSASRNSRSACNQNSKLDKKIEHYRSFIARVTDQKTTDGLRNLIEGMQAQKAALHSEQQER